MVRNGWRPKRDAMSFAEDSFLNDFVLSLLNTGGNIYIPSYII